ncbi:MAG: peroxide stress protein YaaA [Halobacteriovoraceae bacterium]|jgi:cytoplasmic iron level regulating protein YaaA (DUF328/UPF0246 family)|nr:peroxide stress protein YaaA [Halobacteriovoraceae bacterium]|tara:strand:+ start:58446 stop:59216 length:771 start_codon:yes stop_codon:yes gene_type:complete
MKMIVSPAKKLDFELASPIAKFTQPKYLDKSEALIKTLKTYTTGEISKLMKLSDSLSELNVSRYREFHTPFNRENAKQAMYAFKGDTYVGLDAESFDKDDAAFAQKSLRILSGLYGILRPMDLIQAYRLEMGTKLPCEGNKNLYEFWKNTLTKDLNKELKKDGDQALINLASKEYFSSLDFSQLDVPVVTCHFMEKKGSEYKIVGIKAKRARGMMSRFIIKNRIEKVEDLKKFNDGGYKFDSAASEENDLVFKANN